MKSQTNNLREVLRELEDVVANPQFLAAHPKYRAFCNRVYDMPGAAHSVNQMRQFIGLHLITAHWAGGEAHTPVNCGTLAGMVASLAEPHDFPWWYVPAKFVDVALNVTPPPFWQVEGMPFQSFYFLLPKGALRGDEGEDINMIGVARTKWGCGTPGLIITAQDVDGVFWRNVQPIDGNNVVTPQYGFNPARNNSETDSPWANDVLLPFAMTLLGIMSARPELSTGTTRQKVIRKTGKEVWTPRSLGMNYRTVTSGSSGDPAYHVRTHWRRGHLRSQRYGPKNSLIRQVFIDPVLINPA